MSYILDALRKSEARRRMGQAPGLDGGPQTANSGSGRRGVGRFVLLGLAGLVVVVMASLAFVNRDQIGERIAGLGGQETAPGAEQPIEPVLPLAMDDDEGQRERGETAARRDRPAETTVGSEQDRHGPDGRQREQVLSDPDEIEAELARRIEEQERETALAQQEDEDTEPDSRRVRQAPRTTVSAPAPRRRDLPPPEQVAQSEQIEQRLREIEQRHRREEDAEVAQTPATPETEEAPSLPQDDSSVVTEEPVEVAMATTPQPAAEPWRPGGPEYVRVWELPLSIRRDLPELKLTIHVYSRDQQRRFVLVNGQRYTTGDTITAGVRLADIRPEGAVIDYRNYRFLLEP